MIYLDNNATTRPSSGVIRAVRRGLGEFWHNPSSVHRPGQAARAQVELARRAVADLIGAKPREITFTSGGTESIDLAIRGSLGRSPKAVLLTTRVEHAAVRELAQDLEKTRQAEIRWLPVDCEGVAAPILNGEASIVSIQWANNETGAIQPVNEIGVLARAVGAVFHVDATQWVGKMPTDVSTGWCDLLTFSPHKFHGPKGVGVLWARAGVGVRPRLIGTQELAQRGGTENVPGILGAGEAAREAMKWLEKEPERSRLAGLRDRFESAVIAGVPGGGGQRADRPGVVACGTPPTSGFPGSRPRHCCCC